MQLNEKAKAIIKSKSVKIRVTRNGMLQQMTFTVNVVKNGNLSFIELHTDRLIDLAEVKRIANEVGLPVEAENARAFPEGTSAIDFQAINLT